MWTRNNNVSNQNMLKHFIYLSFSKSTTLSLCSLYYRYSSKVSSFFCILSFLVKAISIDQTFYSATHYLAAVWLDSRHDLNRNIVTARSFKKLNNKMLNSFQITDSVDSFYKLKLSETMYIHDVFHSELLRSVINDSLSDQKNESSRSIMINDEDEWEIDDILNSRWYWR